MFVISIPKNFLLVTLLIAGITLISSSPLFRYPRAVKNTAMLDRINVDTYLKNEKAVRQQIKCVVNDGPCDAVGKEIKRLMPDVVKDANICAECSPSQLAKIQKIINHLKIHFPEDWAKAVAKYDAKGV